MRFVSSGRLRRLEREAEQARDRARDVQAQADAAWSRHIRELYTAADRAERAETATAEVAALLAGAVEELSAAQRELMLKDIEIRRLREELSRGPREGETLTVLLHYGEPHAVYASRDDAHADTTTHGIPADHVWTPCGERPPSASTWRCEAFTYNSATNGFHRAYPPAPRMLGGAA